MPWSYQSPPSRVRGLDAFTKPIRVLCAAFMVCEWRVDQIALTGLPASGSSASTASSSSSGAAGAAATTGTAAARADGQVAPWGTAAIATGVCGWIAATTADTATSPTAAKRGTQAAGVAPAGGSRIARRRSSKWCGRAMASAGAAACGVAPSARKMPSRCAA